MNVPSFLSSPVFTIIAGVTAAISAAIIAFWSRRRAYWLLVLLLVVWAVALVGWFALGWFGPPPEVDPGLPGTFRRILPGWLFALAVIAIAVGSRTIAALRRRPAAGTAGAAEPGAFPDLDTALREIEAALDQARIDPRQQPVFLLFGPGTAAVDALVRAARVQPFVVAPRAEEAPIRAYALSEGLVLNVAGSCALGRGLDPGTARLAQVCRWLRDLQPELPILRGLALVLPLDWVAAGDPLGRAPAVRDDLQTAQAVLGVQCPVFVAFSQLETVRGAPEFLARLGPELLGRRCGFALPQQAGVRPDQLARGFEWIARWFQVWSLRMMAEDYRNAADNAAILNLSWYFRQQGTALTHLLAAMLAAHPQDEPIRLRGIYFAACGPAPPAQGFAGGLLRGPKACLFADQAWTTWGRAARDRDRLDRRLALGLLAAAAALGSILWVGGIIDHLRRGGVEWFGWLGLTGLAAGWLAALALARRPRRAAPPAPS